MVCVPDRQRLLKMVNVRKRQQVVVAGRGTRTTISNGAVLSGSVINKWYCEDVEGHRDLANYLFIDQRLYDQMGSISGKASSFPTYRYSTYPYLSQSSFSHLPPSTTKPTNEAIVTGAAARSNPSKPTVSIPVFVAQLKDFPRSLQRAGLLKSKKKLPDFDAGTSADFNFGWDLLYKDVANMFKFTEQVDQRVKQLTAARGVSGARGRGPIAWEDHAVETITGLTVWSLEAFLTVTSTKTSHRRMWGSVRWLADNPGFPDAYQTLSDARRIVHGWRLSPADVWELIPWSWFIDYFVNVGSYLEATTNALGIHPERSCVMTLTETHVVHRITSGPGSGFTAIPSRYRYITKERLPVPLSLSPNTVPLLGPKQLVTLSSIANSQRKYDGIFAPRL